MNTKIANLIEAANRVVTGKVSPSYGRTRLVMLADIEALKIALNAASKASRKHVYWGAGEEDCPNEIKASNGELHTLRCKSCGMDYPKGHCET